MRRLPLWTALGAFAFAGACACDEDLDLLPGDIEGIVCSAETGQPLTGTTVTVTDLLGDEHEENTSIFGSYEFENIPAGAVSISILGDEGERLITDQKVPSNDVLSLGDSNCRPPEPPPPPPPPVLGSVSGCLCDEERHEWAADTNVFINGAEGSLFVTGTDENGCFELDGVPAGTHTLEAQGLGSYAVEVEVTVEEGIDTPIESPVVCEAPAEPEPQPDPPLPLRGEVSGRVCAPDGETWLADASRQCRRSSGDVFRHRNGLSNLLQRRYFVRCAAYRKLYPRAGQRGLHVLSPGARHQPRDGAGAADFGV
ncbi:MAG: hypothetical protein GY822_29115 [Deltaproteobacteria bacterium]|nr:hypothetical protein [Deltaproteobacteria bacterium]